MTRAVQIDRVGGPEQMKVVDVQVGEPGAGQIRIRHKAVGLNFIDVYQRSGLYQLPMPLKLGMEASGIVEAVGEGVTHLKAGDRAAYASQPPGSYCEVRVMPAMNVCKLPDAIDFETGAAMMLKGLTVQYLLKRTLPQGGLKAGDFVLWHAAAGGVGLIACQVGARAGPAAHRHGRVGRQVPAREGARRGPRDQLRQGRLQGAGQGDHRRHGRQGGVRLGRQGHLGQVARLPAAARPDGQLRQCVGPGAAFRARITDCP